jgi:hypothetical protein
MDDQDDLKTVRAIFLTAQAVSAMLWIAIFVLVHYLRSGA